MNYMKQIIKNVRDCYNHIPYTWKHWIAFMKTEKKLLGYHSHWFHDWDKLILFIFFPFLVAFPCEAGMVKINSKQLI